MKRELSSQTSRFCGILLVCCGFLFVWVLFRVTYLLGYKKKAQTCRHGMTYEHLDQWSRLRRGDLVVELTGRKKK